VPLLRGVLEIVLKTHYRGVGVLSKSFSVERFGENDVKSISV
jgi:hypothetical protein